MGENEIPNATFERGLKRLEKAQVLQCIKHQSGPTIIVFSIYLVNNTLEKKETNSNIEFKKLTEEIDQELWEEMFKDEVEQLIEKISSSRSLMGKPYSQYSNLVERKTIATILGLVMSHSLELFILHPSWHVMKSKRKEAIKQLIKAVVPFFSQNPDERFRITIEFNGIQQTADKLTNELKYPMIERTKPYLLIFFRKRPKIQIQ